MTDWVRLHALIFTLTTFIFVKLILLGILLIIFTFFDFSLGDDIFPNYYTNNLLVDLLGTRWDSTYYLTIAESGRYYDPYRLGSVSPIWNFPPLYPFFIRLVMNFGTLVNIAIPVATAGVLVANLFSILSVVCCFYLSRLYFGEGKAIGATLLFAFFPPVLAFSTVAYSEPVFLTFLILSWYFFEKEKYKSAGLTLAIATLARYPGALIFFLYIPVYFGRKIKERGFRSAMGCILAIPLFPLLVLISGIKRFLFTIDERLTSSVSWGDTWSNLKFSDHNREKIEQLLMFFDLNLSWVLIFGLIPLGWLYFINSLSPMPIDEVTTTYWGAKFLYPMAGLIEFLKGGDIKWTLEKYTFVFLFLTLGLFALFKRPSFSLLIIGQSLFYTGFTGNHAWAVPRYIGTIFLGPMVLAEEISSTKLFILILELFVLYGFKILWSFCTRSYWLI